jgi:hypothetical protein
MKFAGLIGQKNCPINGRTNCTADNLANLKISNKINNFRRNVHSEKWISAKWTFGEMASAKWTSVKCPDTVFNGYRPILTVSSESIRV